MNFQTVCSEIPSILIPSLLTKRANFLSCLAGQAALVQWRVLVPLSLSRTTAVAWQTGHSFGMTKVPHNLCNIDYLRDNLVGLDYLQSGSLVANAQTFAFAYIAERGTLHGGSFQFYRFENSYRRNGAGCARPFDVVEFGLSMFVLPFEGEILPS